MVAEGLQQEVQHVSVLLVAMVTEADEAVDVVASSQVLNVLEVTACCEKGAAVRHACGRGGGVTCSSLMIVTPTSCWSTRTTKACRRTPS